MQLAGSTVPLFAPLIKGMVTENTAMDYNVGCHFIYMVLVPSDKKCVLVMLRGRILEQGCRMNSGLPAQQPQ